MSIPRSFSPTSIVVAIVVAIVALVASGCSRSEEPRARNLLLISVDTLQADRLGCYGGPNSPSPAIDALAREGVRFDRAYVPRGMTLASMATYFTSKYPAETGVIDNIHKIGDDEWMLAERLEDADFRRCAINASDVLSPERGHRIDQGFNTSKGAFMTFGDDDRRVAKQAASYVRERFGKGGKRDFLWVHLMSPHKSYAPPMATIERLDPGYRGGLPPLGAEFDAAIERVYTAKQPLPDADLKHVLAIYDGEVAVADACVAEILAALDASGAAKDTLVAFVADHGEDLYLHELYPYHANSPYRSVTRVPWILRQPGAIASERVVPDVVESIDFLPTVLTWLGLSDRIEGDTEANGCRGRDLTPLIATTRVGTIETRYAFGRINECADRPQNLGIVAVRDARWSLVLNTDGWCPAFPPEAGSYSVPPVALFDLDADPHEQKDVAAANPDVVARMTKAAQEHLARQTQRETGLILLPNKDSKNLRELQQDGHLPGADDAPENGSGATDKDDDAAKENEKKLREQGYLGGPGESKSAEPKRRRCTQK